MIRIVVEEAWMRFGKSFMNVDAKILNPTF
jgi:hypothetical protein